MSTIFQPVREYDETESRAEEHIQVISYEFVLYLHICISTYLYFPQVVSTISTPTQVLCVRPDGHTAHEDAERGPREDSRHRARDVDQGAGASLEMWRHPLPDRDPHRGHLQEAGLLRPLVHDHVAAGHVDLLPALPAVHHAGVRAYWSNIFRDIKYFSAHQKPSSGVFWGEKWSAWSLSAAHSASSRVGGHPRCGRWGRACPARGRPRSTAGRGWAAGCRTS